MQSVALVTPVQELAPLGTATTPTIAAHTAQAVALRHTLHKLWPLRYAR
jgi:hypothetical protein